MSQHTLRQQMIRLRRQIRALVFARGLGYWLTLLLAAAMLLVGLDWYARVSPAARTVLLSAWLLLAAGETWRRLLRPLWRPIEIWEIASAADRRIDGARDLVASGVEFASDGAGPRSPLAARVVSEAESRLALLPRNRLLDFTGPVLPLGLGLACLAVVLGIAVWAPGWISTGVARYASPGGPAVWPKWTQIVPLTGDQVAALGEPSEVAMRLARGSDPAWVVADAGAGPQRHAMSRRDGGRYVFEFPAVSVAIRYWFEAGDDATDDRPGRISVYARPEVVRTRLEVTPPEYTRGSAYTTAFEDRRVEVLAGSSVAATFWTSAPLAAGEAVPAAAVHQNPLTTRPAQVPKISFADLAKDRLTAVFQVPDTVSFILELRDLHGLTSSDDRPFTVAAMPDALPTIRRIAPASPLTVTPEAQIDLLFEVRDDVAVSSLKWVAETSSGRSLTVDWSDRLPGTGTKGTVPISEAPGAAGSFEDGNRPLPPTRIAARWSPAAIKAVAGETIACRAEVTDSFLLDGKRHPPVRSAPLEIRLVAPEELARRIEAEAAGQQHLVRQALARQEQLLNRTRQAAAEAGTASRPAGGSGISRQQREISRQTGEIASRYQQLVRQLADNRLTAHAADLAQRLEASLRQADLILERQRQAAELAEAGEMEPVQQQQSVAAEQLRSLLSRWGDQGTAQDVAKQTRELLNRQEELTRRTAAASQPSTSDEERNRLAHAQSTLAADAQRQLARPWPSAAGSSQPAGEDKPAEIARQMRQAAAEIRAGRGEAAGQAQHAAEQGLREVLAGTSLGRKRELEELSRKMTDAVVRLRQLVSTQEQLLGEIAAAGEKADALAELREPQSVLRARTQVAATPASEADPTGRAGALVTAAAGRMKSAADAFAEGDPAGATRNGTAAVEGLKEAIDSIAAAQRENHRRLAAMTLAELREKLTAIKLEQRRILTATAVANAARPGGKVASAPAGRDGVAARLVQLGEAEQQLAAGTQMLQPPLTGVAVSTWTLAALRDAMLQIARQLGAGQSGTLVQHQQQAVIDRINLLLQALADQPGEEGYEQGSAGAAGAAGREPPVSKAAELKLLRGLQADLLDRTVQLSRTAPNRRDRIEQLGREQQELTNLAAGLLNGEQP